MIVKKLRTKRNWSQDQLATLSGVSLRTIQRVEAGNTASLETLKSLSSVFEIDISRLTEEVFVIDKNAEEWKSVPLWVSVGLFGLRSRKVALMFELFSALLGAFGLFGQFVDPRVAPLMTFWAAAYWYAITIRRVDNEQLWK